MTLRDVDLPGHGGRDRGASYASDVSAGIPMNRSPGGVSGGYDRVVLGGSGLDLFPKGAEFNIFRSSRTYFRDGNVPWMIRETNIDLFTQHPNLKTILSFFEDRYDPASVALLNDRGIGYESILIDDFEAPTLDELAHAVEIIESSRIAGTDILLHCGAGIGRTGTFVSAYEAFSVLRLASTLEAQTYVNNMWERVSHQGVETGEQASVLYAYAFKQLVNRKHRRGGGLSATLETLP